MSTGDLLFIFAFIVLPTIILVSCIWTLLLIRSGVLLPARRAVHTEAAPQLEEGSQQPLETAMVHELPVLASAIEPVVIEATALPETVALTTPELLLPEIEPEVLPEVEPEVDAIVPVAALPDPQSVSTAEDQFEQTTDLPIIDDEMIEQAAAAQAQAEPPIPSPAPYAQLAELPTETPWAVTDTEPAIELDVLFIPLLDDEPSTDVPHLASNGVATAEHLDTTADEVSADQAGQPTVRAPRKPVRRVAQLRPSDEPAASVSPMGSLMRRSRSGNHR